MNDRRTHFDLLDQVADSTEERDNVRRVLGAELRDQTSRLPLLTEADLDAQERWKRAPFAIGAVTHAHRYSRPSESNPAEPLTSRRACSLCESGMHFCASPDACQLADDEPPPKRNDNDRPPLMTRDQALSLGLVLLSCASMVFAVAVMLGKLP